MPAQPSPVFRELGPHDMTLTPRSNVNETPSSFALIAGELCSLGATTSTTKIAWASILGVESRAFDFRLF